MTLVLDGFAGAGGWDLALEALGFEGHGVENAPPALATREAAGLTTVALDMWTTPLTALGHYAGQVMSPPCQTFSQAGHGAGRKALDQVLALAPDVAWLSLSGLRAAARALGDERTGLVLTPLWHALHGEAEWLAWEQVPTVLPVWHACAEILKLCGWSVWTGYVHSEQYGVAQTRKRAILIASRIREVSGPPATHSRYHSRDRKRLDHGVLPWVSMADALGHGLTSRPAPTVTGGGTATGGAEPIAHLSRYLHQSDWIPKPAIDGETAADCEWVHERPSPTIVGTFRPDVVAAPGYRKAGDPPRQRTPGSVRVSVAEAGVLQSFPADYPWQGNQGEQYLQAGNAIPPLMALHIIAEASGRPVPDLATQSVTDS